MFTPQPTPYDITFKLFRFPIRIHPLFWIISILMGSQGEIDDMRMWMIGVLAWVAAVFVGILVHELGHGFAFRLVHNTGSMIVLHGMGGVTIPYTQTHRKPGFRGFFGEVFIDAAGVLAGFALAGLLFLLIQHAGRGPLLSNIFVSDFVGSLLWVCIGWGIFNLLPIYPLDGGHISREVLCAISPRTGVANSLMLSIFVAALIALLWIRIGQVIPAVLFGYFGFLSYQQLMSYRRW